MSNSVYRNSGGKRNRNAGPGRNRAKTGPTPKRITQRAARYRAYSRTDLIMGSAGWCQVITHRVLNREAVRDAIESLDDNSAELRYLASDDRTRSELLNHCDVFAARHADDSRWDGWRKYRRSQMAMAS